jgi:hypothetical protein
MSDARRPGAVLIMALLAIILLDCIVLGALHLALQEQHIATNRSAALQLRLDAESGARRALGVWTAEIDTMDVRSGDRIAFPPAGTPGAVVEAERIDDYLFLVESVAQEPPPRFGRSAVRLLVNPPALPPYSDPAPAPVSAAGPVTVGPTGSVVSAPTAGCSAAPAGFSVLAPPFAVTVNPGGALDAPAGPLMPAALIHHFDRLASLAPGLLVAGDSTLTVDAAGVLLVRGTLTIAAASEFRGLLLAGGPIVIEDGSAVYGALHGAAAVSIAGRVQWDPCVVDAALHTAGLHRPTPAGPRAWLPAF